jgi:hypothetical protein
MSDDLLYGEGSFLLEYLEDFGCEKLEQKPFRIIEVIEEEEREEYSFCFRLHDLLFKISDGRVFCIKSKDIKGFTIKELLKTYSITNNEKGGIFFKNSVIKGAPDEFVLKFKRFFSMPNNKWKKVKIERGEA